MTDRTDALIERIRKLRAKADDASVTEAEAAMYAAKVAELLAQHGLSEEVLEEAHVEPIVQEEWDDASAGRAPWRRSVCGAAARLYFCDGYTNQTLARWDAARHPPERECGGFLLSEDRRRFVQRSTYVFVGRRHNAVVAREMSEYLITASLRLSQNWKKDNSETERARMNFARACGLRLAERLDALYWEQRRATAPRRAANGNPGNLPALYADEADLVKKFLEANLNLRTFGRGTTLTDANAAEAGRRAGDTVSLQPQVRGRGTNMLENK